MALCILSSASYISFGRYIIHPESAVPGFKSLKRIKSDSQQLTPWKCRGRGRKIMIPGNPEKHCCFFFGRKINEAYGFFLPQNVEICQFLGYWWFRFLAGIPTCWTSMEMFWKPEKSCRCCWKVLSPPPRMCWRQVPSEPPTKTLWNWGRMAVWMGKGWFLHVLQALLNEGV